MFYFFFSLLDVNIGRGQLLIPSSFKIARGEINFSLLLEKNVYFCSRIELVGKYGCLYPLSVDLLEALRTIQKY